MSCYVWRGCHSERLLPPYLQQLTAEHGAALTGHARVCYRALSIHPNRTFRPSRGDVGVDVGGRLPRRGTVIETGELEVTFVLISRPPTQA